MSRPVTEADVASLVARLSDELRGFRIAYKDESSVQRTLGALVRLWNPRYLSDYTTVLGRTVWLPSRAWRAAQSPRALYLLLRHEAVHLHDMRRFPGVFQLSYALLLPAVVTLRAYWELRAYDESVRAVVELDGHVEDAYLEHIVSRFTGPDYLFMFPFPGVLRRHLRRVAAEATKDLRRKAA